LDAQVAWLANVVSNYLVSGESPQRYGSAHPNIVPYESFRASDAWIAIGVGNDRQWQLLCAGAGWDDLAADPRFGSNPLRVSNRQILVEKLKVRFLERTAVEWVEMLQAAGIPCKTINSIDEVSADPQVLARDMLVELPHPTAGKLRLAGSPFKLLCTPVCLKTPPPLLGQHTEEVLSSYLSHDSAHLAKLRSEGII
jgi:crotonobetainyl-CoA:carnitine CoA-transferase CaiB-like acyl-CoA transferase